MSILTNLGKNEKNFFWGGPTLRKECLNLWEIYNGGPVPEGNNPHMLLKIWHIRLR